MDLAYSGRSPTDTNRFSVDFLPGLLLTISSLAMVISYCEGTISAAVGLGTTSRMHCDTTTLDR